jgi:DNA-binding GntR family transcriptional regulator
MDPNVIPPLLKIATRSDLVVDALRDAILSGRLNPGDVLVERQLAESLGVSKTPVREALIALSARGLVAPNRNHGATVRRLLPIDVQKVYQVRILLEPWAFGETARRQSTEHIEQAREALKEATRYLDAPDAPPELIATNRRFHRMLYSGCGNELIIRRLDEMQDLTALGIATVLWSNRPTWRAERDEHQQILAAVDAGKPSNVESLTRKHIQASLTALSTMMEETDGSQVSQSPASQKPRRGKAAVRQ